MTGFNENIYGIVTGCSSVS